jgi:hypothetical protein
MQVYLRKDKQVDTQMVTPIQIVVKSLTKRSEELGHRLYIDSLSSSAHLFYAL